MALINKNQFIEADAIKKALAEIRNEIDLLKKSSTELQQATRAVNKEGTGAEAKKRIDLTNQLEAQSRKLIQAESAQNKQLQLLKVATQQANKEASTLAKSELKLTSEYAKQSAKLNDLRKQYKDLILQEGKATKQTNKLLNEITKLDSRLKSVDKSVGQSQRSVGRYSDALKGVGSQLLGAAGIVGGVTALVRGIGNGIKIFKTFDKSTSKLASILGKTKDQITALTNQAKELGSTTAFTASEVISLQTELAKLGFTTAQIEASTEGILALAAATGSDLASSAELAGATLRIFNLDASEMSRVTDVLAKSTTISSLSMEKLATIMPTVGKTAQLAGVSLERTAALAGTLTDRGIDASSAATSLRNIFLELSNKGITWNDAMVKINESTDKNKASMDLFGKRAAAAGVILAETALSTDDLTSSLENATGAAQEMADVMLDNLAGDMVKAQSAWEGFILSLEDGDGVFSRVARSATNWVTGLFEALKKVNEGENLLQQKLKKDSDFVGQVNERWAEYVKQLRLANSEEEEAILISQKRRKLQNNIRANQFILNKGVEKGSKLSTIRREELEFDIDFYEELKVKLEAYNKPLEKSNELTEDNTKNTDNNTKSRNSNKKAIFDQNSLIEQQREEYERMLERQTRAEALSGVDIIDTRTQNVQVGETALVANPLTGSFTPELVDEATELTKKLNANIEEENDARRDRESAKEKEEAKAIQAAKIELLESTGAQAADFLKENRQQQADEEIAGINSQAEAQKDILKQQLDDNLITESEFKQKTAAIDKKARQDSAKAQKRATLFQIGIDTAAGIVKALASSPPPVNFINAALVGAQGAIQAALVAAKPLPAFKDGVIGFKGTGTDTSDSNIARISNNESVITAKGTRNAPLGLDMINRGLLTDNDLLKGGIKLQTSNNQPNIDRMISEQQKTNALMSNLGLSYETKDFYYVQRSNGQITKTAK